MPMITDLLTGFVKAEDLEPGVKSEFVIADVKRVEFQEKDGTIVTKAALVAEDGQQTVCNVTRLRVMIRNFGPNTDNWVGQTVLLSRGMTTFSGREVACIRLEAIPATPQIAAQPPKSRGRATITSGKVKAPPTAQAPIDDEIPF
jgi:hypothetical protein